MRRIAAPFVYTLDSKAPLRDAFVEFDDDGTILSVGESKDFSSEKEVFDGAITPGFVNAHCHLELSYMKGMFRKGSGMAGFIDQINALRDTKSDAEKKADIKFWIDRMWDQGVSAMGDVSNCADSFAIKEASKMYVRTFLEVFGTEPSDCQSVMASVSELSEKARTFHLDAAPTPHSCYTMSPQLLTAASAAGLESGYLSYHSEESSEEEEMLESGSGPMFENRKKAGMSMPPVTGQSSLLYFIDRLEKAHPAPFGEHILLVHEVCLNQEGIDALKATMSHPFIALCPLSNLFIHNALPPVELMRCNAMKITVGTDSLSSNDDLSIVKELFCLQENFPEVPVNELFTWACLNGAEFLGKERELGSIACGKKPGLVFVDHISGKGSLTTASSSRRII